jgi:hypothetical protein
MNKAAIVVQIIANNLKNKNEISHFAAKYFQFKITAGSVRNDARKNFASFFLCAFARIFLREIVFALSEFWN